ncbi:MAG: hypothetical protein R3F59_36820 [Myxococcota bacterium]
MATATQMTPRGLAGWLFLGAGTTALLVVAVLAMLFGAPFYLTPVAERTASWFESNQVGGLLFGIAGTFLMSVMLLYSVRKWLPFTGVMGSMTFWMRFHMLCGLLGPLYIVLHAEIKLPTGFIAIGFWCMVLVAVSGFFGRYLFGYFPQAAADLKLDIAQAQKRLTELRAQLVADTRDAEGLNVQHAVALAKGLQFEPRSLGELIILDADVRRRADLIKIMLHRAKLPKEARRRAEATLLEQLFLRRTMAGFDTARRMLRYWNLFHQPLAMAMYIIVAIHILYALYYGGSIATLLSVFG